MPTDPRKHHSPNADLEAPVDKSLSSQSRSGPSARFSHLTVLLSFAALGGVAALSQSVLLREAMVTFHGTELTVGAFYGGWFLWIALGAFAGPPLVRRGPSPTSLYTILLAVYPLTLLLQIVGLRYWRVLNGLSPLEIVTLEEGLLGAAIGAALPGFLTGTLFPLAARTLDSLPELESSSKTVPTLGRVSRLYLWEAVGSLVGGMAFTFALATTLTPPQTLGVACVALGAVAALISSRSRKRWQLVAPGIALTAGVVLWTPAGGRLDRLTEEARWSSLQQGYELKSTQYSPYSHIAVGGFPNAGKSASTGHGVFYDGVLSESFPDEARFSLMAAHIMAQNPWAKRVLLLGGGVEGLAQSLTRYPSLKRIDVVMRDPFAVETLLRFLTPKSRKSLRDPRVHIVRDDARRHLVEKTKARSYDTVVSLFPRPTTASLNRFFTREFFLEAQRVVADGVFVLFFHRDEADYLTPGERNSLAAIQKTLHGVFPRWTLFTGGLHYMAASSRRGRLAKKKTLLAARYRSLRVSKWPYPPQGFPGNSVNGPTSRRLSEALKSAPVAVNRDAAPSAYYHGLVYLGQISQSDLVPVLESIRKAGPAPFFAFWIVLMVFLFVRRISDPDPARDRRRNSLVAVAAVGFASMTLQVVVFVAYSAHHGSLYREVGLLTGAFMFGLATGALAARRVIHRRLEKTETPSRETLRGEAGKGLLALTGALGLLALLAWSLPLLLELLGHRHGWSGRLAYWGLSLSVGLATGWIFPVAARRVDPADQAPSRTASALDASDHLGAFAGGLFSGTVWLPLFGTQTTCWLAATALSGTLVLALLDGVAERLGILSKATPQACWSFPWKGWSWFMATLTGAVVVASAVAEEPTKTRGGGAQAAATDRKDPQATSKIKNPELRNEHRRHLKRKGVEVEEKLKPFPHLRILWKGKLAEVVFSTLHTADEIRGYSGPVELMVRMKSNGTLLEVRMGRHKETPSYVRGVPRWLQRFQGHPPQKPILGPKGVDALSGATVTTSALKRILSKSRAIAMQQILQVKGGAPAPKEGGPWAKALRSLSFWALLALLIFALVAYLLAHMSLRVVSLIGGLLLLGVWLNLPLSVFDLGMLSMGELPASPMKIVAVAAALLLGLFLGQVWCGYLCPFGALQELLWLAVHPKGLRSHAGLGQARRVSEALEKRARYTKFVLLALVLSSFALTRSQEFLMFDPMVWVFTLELNAWKWALLLAILLASIPLLRPWCRYLCPVGALFALSNKVALFDRKGPRRRVNRCDLGVTTPRHADCIRCNRCVMLKKRGPSNG